MISLVEMIEIITISAIIQVNIPRYFSTNVLVIRIDYLLLIYYPITFYLFVTIQLPIKSI